MTTEQDTFQNFIKDKIAGLQQKNKRVSIRSIAQKVGISSGCLVDLINGKRQLSQYYAEKLTEGLRLNRNERDQLFSFIATNSRKKMLPRVLSDQEAEFLVGWEKFALLNLLQVDNFVSSPQWMAQRLGLPVERVTALLSLLERLKLVVLRDGEYVRTSAYLDTTKDLLSKVLQEGHRAALNKALEGLAVEPQLRDYSYVTMAINPAKLPEAKKMIDKFQDDLIALFSSGEKTEVYTLGMQLYPLTLTAEK